jgi:uncharacterized membrane protein (UPF0127 family)
MDLPQYLRLLTLVVLISVAAGISYYYLVQCECNQPNLPEIDPSEIRFVSFPGLAELEVELALTPQEWSQGLMNRAELPPGTGMLFVFEGDAPRTFWMKDTLIPLDMIFLDSSLEIVSIVEDARPCREAQDRDCPRYMSGQPARYVVEANAGFVQESGIKVGENIAFRA